jgi:hypothetical protein
MPRPPQRGENEHPAEDATPRRVRCEQARDLGDGEHQNQVEEQLERRDFMFNAILGLALAVRPTYGHSTGIGHVDRGTSRIVTASACRLTTLPTILGPYQAYLAW